MRVFLLNQFVPPSQAPTARLIGDLAAALQAAGHEVRCIGSAGTYEAAGGVKRIIRDLRAHLQMAWRVLASGRCDWIVALSDPTGLPVTARFLAMVKGASLAHWAMDVYPQTAIALGAVREGWLTRMIASAMHWAYRGCRVLVALDRDMRAEIVPHVRRPVAVLPPWPPEIIPATTPVETRQGRCWLYSGNLGRAHDFETVLRAQQLLEQAGADWELCFQGGGSARAGAEELAARLGLKRCRWSGYAPEEQLLSTLMSADVLIATQKPATRGLLWPSKLSLMKHLGIPIAWIGPVEGAVAEALRQLTVPSGIFAPGDHVALADWLVRLPARDSIVEMPLVREKVCAEREAGTQWWLNQMSSVKIQ
jgi:colanic acid biosynthesis glycosyl transferase WcaI